MSFSISLYSYMLLWCTMCTFCRAFYFCYWIPWMLTTRQFSVHPTKNIMSANFSNNSSSMFWCAIVNTDYTKKSNSLFFLFLECFVLLVYGIFVQCLRRRCVFHMCLSTPSSKFVYTWETSSCWLGDIVCSLVAGRSHIRPSATAFAITIQWFIYWHFAAMFISFSQLLLMVLSFQLHGNTITFRIVQFGLSILLIDRFTRTDLAEQMTEQNKLINLTLASGHHSAPHQHNLNSQKVLGEPFARTTKKLVQFTNVILMCNPFSVTVHCCFEAEKTF